MKKATRKMGVGLDFPYSLKSIYKKRAGEGSRTLDSHVGNVVLYH